MGDNTCIHDLPVDQCHYCKEESFMPKKKDVFTAIQDLKGEEFTRDEISDRMGAGTTGEKAVVFSLIASLIRDDLVTVLEADRYKQPVRLREKKDKGGEDKEPIDEAEVKMKTCSKCQVPKPLEDFYSDRGVCKVCFRLHQAARIIEAKKATISPPEDDRSTLPNPHSDEVEILNLPLPGGISKEFMTGLKTAGEKAFRPWWYQATFYICEGLRKDGYL